MRFVLHRLALVMAPTAPFFAEHLFQAVREGEDEESVHLASWPEESYQPSYWAKLFGGDKSREMLDMMNKARDIVTQALEARDKAGIKVRQPLSLLTIPASSGLPQEFFVLIEDEVNVKRVEKRGDVVVLDTNITEELKEEGFVRDLIRTIQQYRKDSGMKPGEQGIYTVTVGSRVVAEKYRAQIEKTTSTTLVFE
jgi:isoleucyl-tRNA synthetase